MRGSGQKHPWTCPCGNVIHIERWEIKDRKVCGRRCPARACLVGSSAGGVATQEARRRRIMFTYGKSAEWASGFLVGSRRGAQATSWRLRRARETGASKLRGPRAGSSEWEAKSR